MKDKYTMEPRITDTNTIAIGDRIVGYDELIDSVIAGKILGLSPRTVRNMANRREIPSYKIGKRTNRFLVQDLLEWCEERRIENI